MNLETATIKTVAAEMLQFRPRETAYSLMGSIRTTSSLGNEDSRFSKS
jgi:hypothetical protein